MSKEHLQPFKAGLDSRRNLDGRPRKWVSELKEQGYKLSEINDALQVILSMDEDELEKVIDSKEATVLEKTVAKALKKGLGGSSLYNLETLLTRVYGKPKETQEQKVTGIIINKVEIVIVDSRTEITEITTEGNERLTP